MAGPVNTGFANLVLTPGTSLPVRSNKRISSLEIKRLPGRADLQRRLQPGGGRIQRNSAESRSNKSTGGYGTAGHPDGAGDRRGEERRQARHIPIPEG